MAITGYVVQMINVWTSYALGDVLSLVFGLAAIVLLLIILQRTKDHLYTYFKLFLYAFIIFVIITLIRVVSVAYALQDTVGVVVLLAFGNLLFLVLMLAGLYGLAKLIKEICQPRRKK